MRIAAITPNGKHDFLTETVLEGLLELGIDLAVSDNGNGILNALTEEDWVQFASGADLIIAFFGKVRENRPPKYHLLDVVNRWNVTAYVDGSEWTSSAHPTPGQVAAARSNPALRRGTPWNDQRMLEKARWYFKRECYPQDAKLGLIPLPFGITKKSMRRTHAEKKYDIFCCFGQTNDGLRKEAVEICNKLKSEGAKVFDKTNVSKDEYLTALTESRIAIDAWGGGDCCARFWEIIGNSVCCLHQKYNIIIPHPFTEEQAPSFVTPDELEKKLRWLLSDPLAVDDIAHAGHMHGLAHHTSVARARYLIEKLLDEHELDLCHAEQSCDCDIHEFEMQ